MKKIKPIKESNQLADVVVFLRLLNENGIKLIAIKNAPKLLSGHSKLF